ncbi:palmdelphin isoform X2 [Paralichthys olivaceus]|uniref:palmdelphin isoform X2 n=1 Tax=Paralichthys olivaceus TaxID=8255 RepID=UPI0037516405
MCQITNACVHFQLSKADSPVATPLSLLLADRRTSSCHSAVRGHSESPAHLHLPPPRVVLRVREKLCSSSREERRGPTVSMEESDLLKERLQAITEKHRIQEDIRQKKLELDREKLKLQHLKKKALRERWLLQDSASHNATGSSQQQSLLSDQQQTRVLQLNIHRKEMEVEFLEREETMISTNEGFILNRLKAVEKSPEEIIKEAHENFAPEPLQVARVIPDVPESLSPPANNHMEQNARKTLFAMEINVTKNMLTGKSTVLSTATVPPEELNQHTGLKVYDDGRKCVYALNSEEEPHDKTCVSELSASEVEQLLRSATMHRQVNFPNYHQNPRRREDHCFYNHQDKRDRVERCDVTNHGGRYGNHAPRNHAAEEDRGCMQRKLQDEHRYDHQERLHRRQEVRLNQSNLRDGHGSGKHTGMGLHYGNQKDHYYSSNQGRKCPSVQEDRPPSHHRSTVIRSNSRINGVNGSNGCPPPRSHDQEAVSAYQPQLCYTPLNHIPLKDYICVDEEELYCYNPPSYHSARYRGPDRPSDRMPSPLYGDDTPYTILNAMESTEPITAIFMGFQTAQDDSGQGQEFEGSLKAELVIIEDNEDDGGESNVKEKNRHAQPGVSNYSTGSAANGSVGCVEGLEGRRTEGRVEPGIKRILKKQKTCCSVC